MGFYITLCTVHTARDQDQEGRVSILTYVLYTPHRDRDRDTEALFPIVQAPVRVLCSVYEPSLARQRF